MKKFEIVMVVFAIIGICFKLFNLPLSSMFLFVSLLLLSSMYFYLGFAFFNNIKLKNAFKSGSYTGIKPLRIVFSVGFGWGLSILVIGILFGFLSYPLESLLIKTGIVTTLLFLILLLVQGKAEIRKKYGIIIRAAIFLVLGIAMLYLPPYFLDKIQYRNHPDYLEVLIKLKEDPDNEEFAIQFEEEHQKMVLRDE